MLQIEKLDVFYGSIQALYGIEMEVPEGSIVCLIGANGAGKSTLLNTIAGLLRPRQGQMHWQGKDIHRVQEKPYSLEAHRVVEMGIALAPEGRRIFADLSVLENLEMGGYLIRERKRLQERIHEQFALFPRLAERKGQRAGSLSGGEQQMLCVARALMNEPKLLLLDEPSLGLAPLITQDIVETIVRINREQGITILLVEQNARLALQYSQYAYVLENGRISLKGAAAELLQDQRIIELYLGT